MSGPSAPRVSVIGAGAMGAAVATHLVRSVVDVVLLATRYDEAVLEAHGRGKPHPGLAVCLPEDLRIVPDGGWAARLEESTVIVIATSGDGLEPATHAALASVRRPATWVVATKAWDLQTLRHAARVVADAVGDERGVVQVSGPSLAVEVARAVPTSVVCAGWSPDAAREVASILASPAMRTTVSDDVDGVAAGAVVKNVAAVGVGICDGLGESAGLNTKAALFSLALQDMAALTAAVGGRPDTVLGPAGAGDLFVTVLGGRNARFGALVGAGLSPAEALARVASTVEGYSNARTIVALADLYGLELPLMRTVAGVLLDGAPADSVVTRLVRGA